MTTSPSEPVDNPQLPDDAGASDGTAQSGDTDGDQDAEPTSTAPAEDNPTVPDPPD
jgi:hypothetical protein